MSRVGASRNDDVLVLGMNPHVQAEADAIQKSHPGARVLTIRDSARNDQVRGARAGGGQGLHDLRTEAGIQCFVGGLGLTWAQGQRVAAALSSAGADARDELAQLAQVWARAEKGGVIPSRLVLSGHSGGWSLWGEDKGFTNGALTRDSIARLAAALPRAASQVEDLCIAACYNGGETSVEAWRALFPQVRTVWAYNGSAPGTFSGATVHLARWEKATRGAVDVLQADRARGTRKGENVAVWSRRDGYQTATVRESTSGLRARYAEGQAVFARYFEGQERVRDTQRGPLREHYNTLQSLLGRPEVSLAERVSLERARDQTLRLLFYGNVATRFQRTHDASLQRGFEALGRRAPDFSQLSRAEALSRIQSFGAELSRRQPPPRDAVRLWPLLSEGLRELNRAHIPEQWL
ncbi:hypothetical protein [Melittangium boletus]|uniref:Uncharacterized protein n=1 Tax=Melittangium boletus DSM 14713 TaxID=1294270 RepID=A0A250ILM2_9BACT|nr:hypothetical protein [Melittangium boletus]ATB32153.1 hypothetical protein MEBOL_005629 [Melittangium boletus DSM 14713]